MQQLSFLTLAVLLLSQSALTRAAQEKQWQDVPSTNHESGAEYTGSDIGQYQGASEYTGSDIGSYNGGYSNDFGGQINNNNGYSDNGNSYNGDLRPNGYAEQPASGYGGEQVHSNGYGGEQVHSNGYGGEQVHSNGYGGEQVHNNGYGGEQVHSNAYGGEQIQNNGYSGEQVPSNGYGGDSHSTSFSSSGYGDLSSHGYGGGGFGGDDGYGAGLSNEGWDRPVKTVVKHVMKNIAVPHPVPAPVHVPVPKYIKYFKPFAIAKPYAVPHVINVIKHIQKPIPFFASFPVKQTVPFPKFVGLPVQVRVPKPFFIHVPKVVPVAKKVHIPIHVNIPKPYIVPVYKHVPVPVPHKVPKVINVIKEVPHFVKKPVPVYVDDHPSFSSGGNTLSSSSYSNHYGNSGGFGHFGSAGFGNEEDLFGGSQGGNSHGESSFNNAGDLGQHGYSSSQASVTFNNPFLFGGQKLQEFRDFQMLQQSKLQYPSQSYPRAHRQPNKGGDKMNGQAGYQQQQAMMNYNYSSNAPGSSYELNVEMNPANIAEANANYNSAVQNNNYNQAQTNANYNSAVQNNNYNQAQANANYNSAVQHNNYNQAQANVLSEMLFQNNKMANENAAMAAANSLASSALKLSVENLNTQFSQPVYNPNAYAEYAMNPQNTYNVNYSQPYSGQKTAESTEITSSTMVAQDSKPQYYNQHPGNAYSVGFNSNYQTGGFNNIPQMPEFANFNNQKTQFAGGNNFDLSSAYKSKNNYGRFNMENEYKGHNPFTSNQGYQSSPWPVNNYNQDLNTNIMPQMPKYNPQQQSDYSQTSSQSNLGYNQGYSNQNFNLNPSSYSNGQEGYQQPDFKYQNNPQEGFQQNGYVNNENYPQLRYPQTAHASNENNPLGGYQQGAYTSNENNPQQGYQHAGYVKDENIANLNNYSPSGSSSSSTSYSESSSNQDFQTSVSTNNFLKQNEKYDQSPSQTSYASDANIALPAVYSNSEPSISYSTSSSSYGNNFNNMQGYTQSAVNQAASNPLSQDGAASQLSVQSQYNDPNQFSNSHQFTESGQLDNLSKFRETSPLTNPNLFSDFNQLSGQNQVSDTMYLKQQQSSQPVSVSNSNSESPATASYANYVNSGSSSTYSPPSISSSSYSSGQSTGKSEFSPPAEKSYLLPSKPLNLGNKNKTELQASASTNSPDKGKSTYSTSYSYSFTEKANKPGVLYSNIQNPSLSPETAQPLSSNKPQSSKNPDFQYSPQFKTPDLPNAMSNIDEMEKHIQSSASSIINVYTNSPESMGGSKGQTFSFMDPIALGSSQTATFFQPQDSEGNPKMQFSSDDLKALTGSSYHQDPAEPLQTSLDAYVPLQPIYQPSANDQNTVYKEAMSDMGDYKEAISLNSDTGSTKKS